MPLIAITGAHGKTGRAVITALRATWDMRALARTAEQASALEAMGHETVIGDIGDRSTIESLVGGVDAVYHICPNFHPDEAAVGAVIADAAQEIDRLVYHSVLHPQTESMPHHWRKLRVEELLLARRGGRVTFLRPAPYVQNLAAYLATTLSTGQLRLPYSVDRPSAMVDVADVGAAAAVVVADDFEAGSGWDLCGIGSVTPRQIAEEISTITGTPIEAVVTPAPDGTPPEVQMMFAYMDAHGLPGSSRPLRALIGEPTPLATSLARLIEETTATNPPPTDRTAGASR
ncbi:MAG: NmrA family NAD(P)-binding protein [Actinomycetia bacterium]|nr:NmrA family NAD(P)-binding protein [Actinomycetes bacterium]